jgi:rhamnosyltransferase
MTNIVSVIVPTLNAAEGWSRFAQSLLACVDAKQVLVIDSESTDGTQQLARLAGFQVHSIRRSTFNHGGTRQLGAERLGASQILVYLTQDAILAGPDSVAKLLAAFNDSHVAVAYGRQLPREGACVIEAHARAFNYPKESEVRDLAAREQLGFKTVFVSNSFAAYRRSALMEVGGFPSNVIFGEDTVTVGRLLMAGYRIAYVADATAYHSHGYSWGQEFRRYFDIGVLHARERWLLEAFGGATGEGRRFVASELSSLIREDAQKVPSALIRAGLKFAGYRLGRMERRLSTRLKLQLSMQQNFWLRDGISPASRNDLHQAGSVADGPTAAQSDFRFENRAQAD